MFQGFYLYDKDYETVQKRSFRVNLLPIDRGGDVNQTRTTAELIGPSSSKELGLGDKLLEPWLVLALNPTPQSEVCLFLPFLKLFLFLQITDNLNKYLLHKVFKILSMNFDLNVATLYLLSQS